MMINFRFFTGLAFRNHLFKGAAQVRVDADTMQGTWLLKRLAPQVLPNIRQIDQQVRD